MKCRECEYLEEKIERVAKATDQEIAGLRKDLNTVSNDLHHVSCRIKAVCDYFGLHIVDAAGGHNIFWDLICVPKETLEKNSKGCCGKCKK